jgi:glyoxylase-like metal-dependent hydrolase (beta-lactamase superfamily II)
VAADSYRFRVGSIECIAVSDGTFTYPSAAFAANAPAGQFDSELQAHDLPPHEVVSPYTCLVVDTGRHRVLVDTGAGFAPTNGKLVENLAGLGIAPTDIDTVVLTHGHADHVGGNTDAAGSPTFPKARYVMSRDEWAFWTQDQPDLRSMPADEHLKHLLVESAHAKLRPLHERVELIAGESEIVPGVQAIAAPGHTPGHIALSISSGAEQVLHLADTVLHPILMERPEWVPAFDLVPDLAAATKRRLLDRAAADRALALAFHFPPFPSLGHVVPQGNAWRWQPLEPTA